MVKLKRVRGEVAGRGLESHTKEFFNFLSLYSKDEKVHVGFYIQEFCSIPGHSAGHIVCSP